MSVQKDQTASGAAEETGGGVEEGFVPIIGQAPGFVVYYFLHASNDVVTPSSCPCLRITGASFACSLGLTGSPGFQT